MRYSLRLLAWSVLAITMLSGTARANESVMAATKDPNNWAIWGGNYAGNRYSSLDQINTSNVGNLRPAWTFSTGVLRG